MNSNKKYPRLILLNILFSMCTSYCAISQISNPIDIGGISAWWCADSIKQDDGTFVSFWQSLDAHGLGVSQPLEEFSPVFVKNVSELNNHAVLRFDGDDYLDGGNILNVGKVGQTAFVVAKSVGVNGCFFAKSLAGLGNSRYYCMYENSKPTFLIQYAKDYYGPIGVSKKNMYEQFSTTIDGIRGKMSFFQNFVGIQEKETFQVAYNFTSSYNFLVGAYNNTSGTLPPNPSYYLTGDIAELIFYDRPLSNIERQSVENYLRSKYFPGTEREQFSFGDDIEQPYSLKPVILSVPDRSYFKTFLWNTGDISQSISVNSSGMYSVFVTDDWGYEYVDTISISFPELKYIQSQTICDGQSILWDCGLSGDYSYRWSSGETSQSISITKAGNYAVTVTDKDGYSLTSDTVTIFVDDFSTSASLGVDTSICSGNSIGLKTRSEDAKHYLWNTGDTTSTIIVQTEGVYSVAVSDKFGCVATDDVQISIKGVAPVVRLVSQYHCLGDTTELISNSYTTDNTQITQTSWVLGNDTLGGTTQQCVFETDGSFPITLVVENEVGCAQSLIDTIVIYPVPDVRFAPKISCQYTANEIVSQSSIKSGTIESYQWFFQDKKSSDSYITFGSEEIGTYPVSLRVTSDKGCINESTDTVVVHPSTKIEFVHTTPCVGDTVLFFDATNYQSQNAMLDGFWLFDSKKYMYNEVFGVKVSDTLPHPVSLHVRTFNGCENIAMDTIFAHDLPRPSVADTVYGCRGTEVLLSDKGMSVDSIREYKWTINGDDSFEKQPAVVFSESGTYPYSLQLTTMYDCSNQTHGVIVMEDFPKADFSFYPEYGAAPLEVEFTNLSENAVDYLWTFEQSVVSEEESPVYIFEDKTRSYAKMRASSKHGCADSVTKYIPVQISDMRLQVTNVESVLQNGKVQYTVQVLNTGNDNIPEIELALSSSKFPSLIEIWYGSLKPNNVLTYTFSVKTSTIDNEIPSYVCATASISAKNHTYYSNQFCKDNTGEFTVYHISPNPVEKHATLAFSTKQKGCVTIDCIDENGKIRLSQEFTDVSAGYHSLMFDVSSLPSGRYVFQVKQGNKKEAVAVMKK